MKLMSWSVDIWSIHILATMTSYIHEGEIISHNKNNIGYLITVYFLNGYFVQNTQMDK